MAINRIYAHKWRSSANCCIFNETIYNKAAIYSAMCFLRLLGLFSAHVLLEQQSSSLYIQFNLLHSYLVIILSISAMQVTKLASIFSSSDAYVFMLVLSFVALIIACFLCLKVALQKSESKS